MINTVERQPDLSDEQRRVLDLLIDAGHDPDQAEAWVREQVEEVAWEPVQRRFEVHDEVGADRVMRKLAEIDADGQTIDDQEAAALFPIRERAAKLRESLQNRRIFFEMVYGPQLEELAKKKLEGKRERSLNGIFGRYGFRAGRDRRVVDNEQEAIRWAEGQNPEAVKKSVLVSKFTDEDMAFLDSLGAAHVEPGVDSFYMEPSLPGGAK